MGVSKRMWTKKKTRRQLINVKAVTGYSLRTQSGEEIAYFLIQPLNLSVLSPESLAARVYALMNVLKGLTELELLCMDSRENFETNKQYLRARMETEENERLRALLAQDAQMLDSIQVQTTTAREFLLLVRLRGLKQQEVFPFLGRVEKLIQEQGFKARRANAQDIRRLLAVYFEQDVTTERFEELGGESD